MQMWIKVFEFSEGLNCDNTSRFDAFISYIGCNTRFQVVRQNLPCTSAKLCKEFSVMHKVWAQSLGDELRQGCR